MKNYFRSFKIRSGSAGFTLIELLIAMSIMSIVMALLGSGLVTILRQNQSAETETFNRTNINRALDFITDEARAANILTGSSSTAPTAPIVPPAWDWAVSNGLGSTGSPTAKLYLQIPLSVVSMPSSNDYVNIPNHGFLTGNVVRFTGTAPITGGLLINTNYYVVVSNKDKDKFKVASTLANAVNTPPTTIDLTIVSSGSVTVNKLVIYYIIDKTSTWWGNKTVNRSLGPCSTASNCSVLVDAIAINKPVPDPTTDGFTAKVTNSRQVTVTLTGQLNDLTTPKLASPLSASAFARSQ